MKAMLRQIVLATAVALIPGIQTGVVFAFTDFQLNAVNEDRPLYDPNECAVPAAAPAAAGGGDGSSTSGNDNAVTVYKFLIGKGLAPFRAAAIIGNLMQESHVNPSSGNPAASGGGGGIVQWEGGRWNGSAGLLTFASGSEDFGPKGSYAGENTPGKWDNLTVQMNYMWWEATHTHSNALSALKAATNVTAATIAWEKAYEGASIPMMDNRINFAKDALADPKMGNGAPASGPADTSANPKPGTGGTTGPPPGADAQECNIGDTSGVGGGGPISVTALGDLAWPTPECVQDAYGQHRGGCHDYTTQYYAANVHPEGLDPYTDCGTFVSTVMHVSKSDTNYPVVGTQVQKAYVKDHPALYKVTANPTSTSQLASGDILISDGHTMIYVGVDGGKYPRVDGSWHDHTPHRGTSGGVKWMLGEPGLVAVHFLGTAK